MSRWEYRHLWVASNKRETTRLGGIKVLIFNEHETMLNAMDADGWELVAVSPVVSQDGFYYTFKRNRE